MEADNNIRFVSSASLATIQSVYQFTHLPSTNKKLQFCSYATSTSACILIAFLQFFICGGTDAAGLERQRYLHTAYVFVSVKSFVTQLLADCSFSV